MNYRHILLKYADDMELFTHIEPPQDKLDLNRTSNYKVSDV